MADEVLPCRLRGNWHLRRAVSSGQSFGLEMKRGRRFYVWQLHHDPMLRIGRPLFALLFVVAAGLIVVISKDRSIKGTKAMSEEVDPPAEITKKVFKQWRDARRGKRAAEDLSNPYWSWLVRSEDSSWSANEHFKGPSSYGGNAAWSAERFGQSTTNLPDGRILLIAGEHEDHYDPDFFIYNDIIVRHPDERIEILGFPKKVFPPTDFHSASLVDGKIILIGNLGYPEDRKTGETQILVIDPKTWEIRKQPSTGESPGWIHSHQATVDNGFITITRGNVWKDHDTQLIENFDDWRLSLTDWTWERLTHRVVTVFEIARKDGEMIGLHEISMWLMQEKHGPLPAFEMPHMDDHEVKEMLENSMKGTEPKDREAFERLYMPDGVDFKPPPATEDDLEIRIEVEGILVRYRDSMDHIALTIEGELKPELINQLRDDLKTKLERATGKPFIVRQLKP